MAAGIRAREISGKTTLGLLLGSLLLPAMAATGGEHGADLEPEVQSKAGDPGQVVAFQYSLRNTGNSSDNYTISVSPPPQGWNATVSPGQASLAPNATRDVFLYVTIGANATEGSSHNLTLTARSEGNPLAYDDAVARVTVNQTAPPPEPDLVVVDIVWSPVYPQAGDSVTFTGTVKNQGNESAGNFTVRFVLDNATLSDHAVGGLAPRASMNVSSVVWNATAGNHTIKAIADVYGQVNESNEGNNERSEGFSVAQPPPPPPPPKPDLIVVDISWSPAFPVSGNNTTFTAWIKNDGQGSSGGFYVGFRLDNGTTLGDVLVPSLGAGNSTNVTSVGWNATQGNHTIRVVADLYGHQNESNEGNNERVESFSVAPPPPPPPPPKPDLVVLDITWSPVSLVAGNNTTFTATVKNQGNGSAGFFWVRFRLDGNVSLGDRAVSALAAGATVNVTSDAWNATQGNHTIQADADAYGQADESNEANNNRTESFSVAAPPPPPPPPPPKPDLLVLDIVWSPAAPIADQCVTFTGTVKNQGNGSAANFSVRLLLDGGVLAEPGLPGLAPGASANVSSGCWNATAGNHTIRAVADVYGVVDESDEANNARLEAFAVAAAPPVREVIYRIEVDFGMGGEIVVVTNKTLGRSYANVRVMGSCPGSAGYFAMVRASAAPLYEQATCIEGFFAGTGHEVLAPGFYDIAYALAGSGRFVIEVTGEPA